jgi:murein DD-endopeptidase MepM/ murein hydrolase activator NlpD
MRGACLAIGFLWAAACPGAEFLYRLPWPQGMSFTFTQVADGRITSHFTKATLHAVDIAMPVGVPVLAARAGVVEALEAEHGASAEEEPFSYEGNFVRVRHGDGTAAIYAHLARHGVAVVVGEAVETGQLLGRSGASGDIAEPQLHFAVIRTDKNAAGWREEIALPVTFYVGTPPVLFRPRAALRVTAEYSGPAQAPRSASEWQPLVPRQVAPLSPGDEAAAWSLLVAWLAAALAGMAWFWQFSKRD